MKGKINGLTPSVILTQMDITGGQSGSAGYLIDNATGTYRQVGIVSFGGPTMNGIVRFSEATLNSMKEWCVTFKCTIPTGDPISLTVTPTRTPTKTPTATPTVSATVPATATPTGTVVAGKPFRLFAGLIAVTK